MKIFVRLCMIVVSIAIPLVCILSAGVFVSRMPDLYAYEFSKLRSMESLEIDVKPEEMADLFSGYINGSVDTFQMRALYRGEEADLFSEKEQRHMADVKTLINYLTMASVVFAFLLVAGVFFLIREQHKHLLRRAYWTGCGLYAAVAVFLAVVAALDFTAGFTVFHEIFFTNDLWILDPKQDVLLMIMPEKFFSEGALIVFVIAALMMAVIGYVFRRLSRERKMFYEN